MNCRRFEDWLEEYADGTLPPADRVAADHHLAGCAVCREALHRHHQTGQALSHSFQKATASLRLRPEVKQRLLRDLAAHSVAEADRLDDAWNFVRFLWPWPAVAAALVAAGWLVWQGVPSPPPAVEAPRASEPNPRVSIHVAYCVPTHTFQKEGAFVRDSLVYHTVVVNGGLGSAPNPKHRNWK
ncbi:MAG TPA: zf-HC2 domain-containing protein [Bacillota bacterium]|nr:zf-HC2 domain-containing protein [Bacillota bacterium]